MVFCSFTCVFHPQRNAHFCKRFVRVSERQPKLSLTEHFCKYLLTEAKFSVNTSHCECCMSLFRSAHHHLSCQMPQKTLCFLLLFFHSLWFLPQRLLCQEEAAHPLWCVYSLCFCARQFSKSHFKSENWGLEWTWKTRDLLLSTRSDATLCLCVKCFADWSESFRI